tara:strand:+ start:3826 stop:4179 length:354 start_codon:yes stop_codon:yes gene_type:complete
MKIIKPSVIPVDGNKLIEEYIGLVNTNNKDISVAKMVTPKGWSEVGQTPEFKEYIIMTKGVLEIKTETEVISVGVGESVVIKKGEWVQFSSPTVESEYIAICTPAFSIDLVNRDTLN